MRGCRRRVRSVYIITWQGARAGKHKRNDALTMTKRRAHTCRDALPSARTHLPRMQRNRPSGVTGSMESNVRA
eukprot:3579427-Prymnesium_polylepis.2